MSETTNESERCPTCGSESQTICNGDSVKYARPHRHGKWHCCCRDPWHSIPAPQAQPPAAEQCAIEVLTNYAGRYVHPEEHSNPQALIDSMIKGAAETIERYVAERVAALSNQLVMQKKDLIQLGIDKGKLESDLAEARAPLVKLRERLDVMMKELNGGGFWDLYTHVILPQIIRLETPGVSGTDEK